MHAIVRTRALNDALKQYQRLPELPVIDAGDHRSMQSLIGAALAPAAGQSRNVDEEQPAEVLAD